MAGVLGRAAVLSLQSANDAENCAVTTDTESGGMVSVLCSREHSAKALLNGNSSKERGTRTKVVRGYSTRVS